MGKLQAEVNENNAVDKGLRGIKRRDQLACKGRLDPASTSVQRGERMWEGDPIPLLGLHQRVVEVPPRLVSPDAVEGVEASLEFAVGRHVAIPDVQLNPLVMAEGRF